MKLLQALRLEDSFSLAAVGAGGKTSALFTLANELKTQVILTTTTHFHKNQLSFADVHFVVSGTGSPKLVLPDQFGKIMITGQVENERATGLDTGEISKLHKNCFGKYSLLIEADGSRQHPLKAPAEHEPVIPDFVDTVLVVAGLDGVGKTLTEENVHRSHIFSQLTKLPLNEKITKDSLIFYLTHPAGGLKGIPPGAKRIALLTQAGKNSIILSDVDINQLLSYYDAIVTANFDLPLENGRQLISVTGVYEPVAAIILAAGGATRYGEIKQLLPWLGKTMIQHIVETTLASRVFEIVLVTGSSGEKIESVIGDLPIKIRRNLNWQDGISSSIRTGLQVISPKSGAAIFILADQPAISSSLITKILDLHSQTLSPIIIPQVKSVRTNPVLFDQRTFPDLLELKGDIGGKSLFNKFPVSLFSWEDERLLTDIDTPEDYTKMLNRSHS